MLCIPIMRHNRMSRDKDNRTQLSDMSADFQPKNKGEKATQFAPHRPENRGRGLRMREA